VAIHVSILLEGPRRGAMGEVMQTAMICRSLDRIPLARIAHGLAIAAVVSLPWSTSLTAILIVLWLLALVPILDFASLRPILATPAGALPVALWAFALIGMLWSIAPPGELFGGFQAYARFLVIPLLLVQFRKSGRVDRVLGGFLISCIVLLIASFILKAWPGLWWRTLPLPGIPVKDYVVQSGEFLLCAFGLAHWAIDAWRQNRRGWAFALAALALAFLVNIIFIATSRAAFVVFVVLVGLLAFQRFSRKGALAVMIGGAVLAGAAWVSSPPLRERIMEVSQDVELYENGSAATSSGYRLNWW
jgi:O-antigen ligase